MTSVLFKGHTTDQPGVIDTVGLDFIYQLDASPSSHKTNLWCASVSANNGYDPIYAHKAVQLFKAAPKLLEVATAFRQKLATYQSVYPGDKQLRSLLVQCDTAIAEATKEIP